MMDSPRLCFWGFCFGGLLLLGMSGADAAPPEVRGTWLTTTGTEDHIRSGVNTGAVMADLRDIGLNVVYVETWKNGYTNFPSRTLAGLTGGPDRSTFLGTTRDLVQETSIEAHRNQLPYVGWFEYGFSAQFLGTTGTPSNPLAITARNRGWLLQDRQGKFTNSSNGYTWMNPAVPEVRQFLIDLTLEAIDRYDLDGIQFDDRLAWPNEFGWDATTAALYQAETGRSLPSSVTDSHFRNWRQQKVTQFATQLYTAVKSARPELLVSVSPSITGFAEPNYNADWTDWLERGLFDEYVPQIYRDSLASFNSTVPSQVTPFQPDELDKLVMGLRINGSTPDTPFNDLQGMIQRSRTEQSAGHSLWYSRGVRDTYGAALTGFYDSAGSGRADHPYFGADWRPVPVVGTAAGSGFWQVDVDVPHRYRVVAKSQGRWTEVNSLELQPGTWSLLVPNVSEVELLLDRRSEVGYLGDFNQDGRWDCVDIEALVAKVAAAVPEIRFDLTGDTLVNLADVHRWLELAGSVNLGPGSSFVPGDANLDGVVDGTDFNRWNSYKFSALASWCLGDFNADGLMDGSDFNIWNRNKFSSSGGSSLVPEPAVSLALLLMIVRGWLPRRHGA